MGMNRGSEWARWDVHLHTPGTALNDQFPADSMDQFIDKVNGASPSVIALGVTDYLSVENYAIVRARWEKGEMPNVLLLFANVELRLSIQTEKPQPLNLHILVSPDDPEHLQKIRAKLGLLTFDYKKEPYQCTPEDLARLGAVCCPEIQDKNLRLSAGVNAFKPDFGKVRTWFEGDKWLKDNCLVAVDGGKNAGASGLQGDGGMVSVRKEIQRFSDIVFSGNPKDREFWLAQNPEFREEVLREYRRPKPCLHGSDAHRLEEVLEPKEERRCWIRARPTFDGLRQVLFEPGERVWLGSEPPTRPRNNWVRGCGIRDAEWSKTPDVPLNAGLVAIIGPRGSGKTALADLIAHGADSFVSGGSSFLDKAIDFMGGAKVDLTWAGDPENPTRRVVGEGVQDSPGARYLSQHFVDQLCSPQGPTDGLVDELERVIFDATEETQRLRASSFAQLREAVTQGSAARVEAHRIEITKCNTEIAKEIASKERLAPCELRLVKLQETATELANTASKLVVKGKEAKVEQLRQLRESTALIEEKIAQLLAIDQQIQDVAGELATLRQYMEDQYAYMSARLTSMGLSAVDVEFFRLRFTGDVDSVLQRRREQIVGEIERRKTGPDGGGQQVGLQKMKEQLAALQKEVSGDLAREHQLVEIQKREKLTRQEREKVSAEIVVIKSASERIRVASKRRMDRYLQVFDEIRGQKSAMERLYAPVTDRLRNGPLERRKLEFYVRTEVNTPAWAARGEALIDLRRASPFQTPGSLLLSARRSLEKPWREGDRTSIEKGLQEMYQAFSEGKQMLVKEATLASLAEWLFSTDHVRISYGIRFEGTEIEKLSSGTRGIVLLMLYLGLDDQDDRPLLIDQPEENLDPQSVFEVLTEYFKLVRKRRQVILVTHNANLVVNTDADQVIIASGVRDQLGSLPSIRYEAGALEDSEIRARVCQILEGGAEAFLQRERRYGLQRLL
ncbi:MAG: hypothetical protein FD180_1478 [Planctomycetota bacterium]|nr:MAG: hypothetical protein FD180_1478 [Planctomycetota bacterium]